MKDLIKLMDPKYIEVWGKFTHVEEFLSIHIAIMDADTKWEQMAEKECCGTICTRKKLTIDNSILYRKGFAVYTYTANIL